MTDPAQQPQAPQAPTTSFLALRDALTAHLAQAPALADGRIYPARVRPIVQGEASAVTLHLLQSTPTAGRILGADDWLTTILITCVARSNAQHDAAAAADALLHSAYQRLHSFGSSPSAAALGVWDVCQASAIDWEQLAEDTTYASASLRVCIAHRTAGTTFTPL